MKIRLRSSCKYDSVHFQLLTFSKTDLEQVKKMFSLTEAVNCQIVVEEGGIFKWHLLTSPDILAFKTAKNKKINFINFEKQR